MTINRRASRVVRRLLQRRSRAAAIPCPAQQSGPTADWGASVMQSIRCELPLMESILRVM